MGQQNHRGWINDAVDAINADFNRSADTHLVRVALPATPRISLYLKDESTHPTGSLKHRLARSLFLYSLCNGRIGPDTTIVEASSGSTAVSEAYFAQLLGLPFVAVMPRTTSGEKIAEIGRFGGKVHLVTDPRDVYAEAERLARSVDGHYMDQFTHAERATDWRGNNNIAESIFEQMAREPCAIPAWIIVGAGTGGTSATIGRYVRLRKFPTQICLADPEASVFHRNFSDRDICRSDLPPSIIEGIGRPRCEASFLPDVIDRAYAVSDAESVAAARVLAERLGRTCGGSTGTCMWVAAKLISEMVLRGETGSVVTLLCDSGERYRSTLFNDSWLASRSIDLTQQIAEITRFFAQGHLD